jgi:hypothetical protein
MPDRAGDRGAEIWSWCLTVTSISSMTDHSAVCRHAGGGCAEHPDLEAADCRGWVARHCARRLCVPAPRGALTTFGYQLRHLGRDRDWGTVRGPGSLGPFVSRQSRSTPALSAWWPATGPGPGRAWSPLGTAAGGGATRRAAPGRCAGRVRGGGRPHVGHDRKRGGRWAEAWRRGCRWTGPARPT